MTDNIATVEPEDVFEKMSLEEFVNFSKYGFNYVMFHSTKKMVRKGDIVNLDGEFLKINAGVKEIVSPFLDLSVDDLRKGLLNELARIGITLTFISLGEHNKVSKLKEDGFTMTEKELKKEIEKELKVINNTSVILKKIMTIRANDLGIDVTKEVPINGQ